MMQAVALRQHSDASVRERAVKVIGAAINGNRDEIIRGFRPALDLRGDTQRGKGAAKLFWLHRRNEGGRELLWFDRERSRKQRCRSSTVRHRDSRRAWADRKDASFQTIAHAGGAGGRIDQPGSC